jgi:N-methylhydantoinase A
VFEGIEEVGVELDEIGLFSHGTTVAINALITRSFPWAAMITINGFRDVIEIRRGTRQDLWDTYKDLARPTSAVATASRLPSEWTYAGKEVDPVGEGDRFWPG